MKNLKRICALLLTLIVTAALAVPAFAAVEDTGFTDVPSDADYAPAVAWCKEQGLMNGTSATTFAPDATLTRAMVVTVLYRAEQEPQVEWNDVFSDVAAGQWYSAAIAWASANGIVGGYGNGLFGTNDPITKEQLDVIIRRYKGETPTWTGDPALAVPATRAEAATAFYNTLKDSEAETPAQESKVLIAYFSATNNTEGIANHIKNILGADAGLYEIVPEQPYTSADLNYNTDCRANREQNDASARPAISGRVENMEQYDVIFLGYPIWWGQAPKIISTFLESYDFSGKTIVPFCTSGSSGIGSSASNLHSLASNATWLDGQRFSGGASRSTVESWVNGLDLTLAPAA